MADKKPEGLENEQQLSGENVALIEDRVAKLDAIVFRSIARRREASIEAGRAFNELKKLLGHGHWQRHVKETFEKHGITLRTAERYMKRARREDSKNDNESNLEPATDKAAQAKRKATEQAETEVDAALIMNKAGKDEGLYNLPLRMTAEEQDATDALQKSQKWPRAETRIVRELRRLFIKYDILTNRK